MSPFRPDLVECWVFRVPPGGSAAHLGEPEFLLIHRAPDRIFPGLWQCVTGGVEANERVPQAALREVREEVGFGPDQVESFYDLDRANLFYDEGPDAIISSAVFALRVRPDSRPRLSHEHDAFRWATRDEALGLLVWPAYREAMDRVIDRLLDGEAEPWFRLDLDGRRLAR